ncbi:MAG: helix-turn-helix transcriptional regulator [Clostridia bacterium]|nr:helix-turn-helix transcriptional regulator [Clostridia bacterium]
MFHQPTNTFGKFIYNAFIYTGCAYDGHFHRSFEFIYSISGESDMSVDNRSFVLGEGEGAIVFPYQAHSFKTPSSAKLYVLVFSGDSLPALAEMAQKGVPKEAKINFYEYEKDFLAASLFQKTQKPEEFTYSAALSVIAAGVVRSSELVERGKSEEVVMKVIEYVEKNYTEDITLKDAANELGYNYQYLSRLFGSIMKMNFRTLVNQYRIDKAEEIIAKQGVSVTEAAFESGFGSIRNYNRVKKCFKTKP